MVYVMKQFRPLLLVALVILSACSTDDSVAIQDASADPVDTSISARNSHELIAYIEAFSGGLNLNNNDIANQFDRKAAQLATGGGMTSSALRATTELLAQVCVTTSNDGVRRRLVYGDVNLNVLPAALNASSRRLVVESLMIRASGRKPAPEVLAEGILGFNELLASGVVANSTTGTLQAAQGICTAIAGSAVAGMGY